MEDSNFVLLEKTETIKQESFTSIFSYKKESEYEIIEEKESEEINSSLTNKFPTNTYWNYIKKLFTDNKNILIFNYLSNQKKFNSISSKYIQIFSKNYLTQNDEFLNKLSNIAYFSYRNDFEPIVYNYNSITSDAGWGCMIRVSQMFLSQAIYRLFNLNNINEFLEKFIFLFLENPIPTEYLHKKGDNINQSQKIIIQKNSTLFDSFFNFGNNFIQGFEEILKKRNNVKFITPPFSLRNICQINPKIGKNPGNWYSNYDIMNIFSEINQQFFPLSRFSNKDVLFFNYPYGTIYLKEILDNCFEKIECNCYGKSFYIPDNYDLSKEINGFIICENKKEEFKCNCYEDTININNIQYKMKKNFIITVSVRHGLRKINDSIKDKVLDVFNYENNIGIIGGKETRALYFIGKCDRNLIFLDPHLVQKTYSINDILVGNGVNTYQPNDIFYINIDDMSPSFTIGFVFKDIFDFISFIKNSGDIINKDKIRLSLQIDSLFIVKYDKRNSKNQEEETLISFNMKQ